jgi:hypothetical protein
VALESFYLFEQWNMNWCAAQIGIADDWGYFCYKHFDHHLRQFGQ